VATVYVLQNTSGDVLAQVREVMSATHKRKLSYTVTIRDKDVMFNLSDNVANILKAHFPDIKPEDAEITMRKALKRAKDGDKSLEFTTDDGVNLKVDPHMKLSMLKSQYDRLKTQKL